MPEGDEEAGPSQAPAAPRPGLLDRLIPAAPPLPGREDPLRQFGYRGPLRGLVAAQYLLVRNPAPWVGAGVVWFLAWFGIWFGGSDLVASLAQYLALGAAGWFGWQRPWLFGVAAAILGWVLIVLLLVTNGPPSSSASALAIGIGEQTVLQVLVGFVAGWYGGYLRRRLAKPQAAAGREPARKR